MTRTPHEDVLIIGAGPSGLFAAAELARHGVRARLVERDTTPHRQARATAIQPGTLEILESAGVLQPFLDTAEHVHCSRLYGPGMVELGALSHDGLDCRCAFQCSLPQYETQRILEAHLAILGGSVERGVAATTIEADADGVTVELLHADGTKETVRARHVIGAGGAHSVTRRSMDETLEGATYRGRFLAADIAMAGPLRRGEAGVICSPQGLVLLAPLPGGRWISFLDLEEDLEDVRPEDVIERVATRLGGRHRPTDVAWFAPFRMHRRIVARLTDGRRFLIGDAAHLSSPFGGEGLNAGLHDAYDLAWKLALVLRGRASRALLDHYAAERAIADRHVLEVSDDVHESIAGVLAAVRQGLPVEPAVVDPVTGALVRNARSMIDVDYAGSPLVADHAPDAASDDGPHPGQRHPDWTRFAGTSHHALLFGGAQDAEAGERLDRLARRWARLLRIARDPDVDARRAGVPEGGLVLLRPDGHIGFRFPSTGPEAIEALDRHLASYLVPSVASE